MLDIFDDITIKINFSEPIKSLEPKVLSMDSENINFTQIINNTTDDFSATINIGGPFISNDHITLSVNNAVDFAGIFNSDNNLDFNYNVKLLADFDENGDIGVNDLNQFVAGWESKDPLFEIGPVTGQAPYFYPSLDGIYNGRDGMVFYRMWHWDKSQAGKLIAKKSNQTGPKLNTLIENNQLSIIPPFGTKASEVIINYPSSDLMIVSKQVNDVSSSKMSLSFEDTLSGQLLNHQIISDDQSIYFDLEHFKKNDIIIYLSYLFLNQDNEPISSGSSELIVSPVPDEFALHQNYPNPFNPVTTINYDLPEESYVNLFIYDILGREVANLVGNVKPAGYQSVTWNTNNILGVPVSAGIYFYQIQTNKYVKTRKMVILK